MELSATTGTITWEAVGPYITLSDRTGSPSRTVRAGWDAMAHLPEMEGRFSVDRNIRDLLAAWFYNYASAPKHCDEQDPTPSDELDSFLSEFNIIEDNK